jgi:hypothetical protein
LSSDERRRVAYTTFLLLLEFAAGCQVVLMLVARRDDVSKGFVKMGAVLVPLTVLPALWLASTFSGVTEVADYPLDGDWLLPLRVTLALFSLLSLVYTLLVWRNGCRHRHPGVGAAATGVAAIALTAGHVRLPTGDLGRC